MKLYNNNVFIRILIIKPSIEKWSKSVFVGIDKLLAQHIAHLFIRDPLSLFEENIYLDDENESDHFEVKMIPTQYWLIVTTWLFVTRLISVIL